MGQNIEVASLFSSLGLKIDRNAWKKGDDAISGMRSSLGSLAKIATGALAGFGLVSAVKSGVAFNATMEDTRNQIAGMLALAKHTDMADQFADSDAMLASLQERAKKLPGSLTDYTKVLGMIAQPITDAGIGLKDLEDLTVGAAVAAKAMNVDLEAAARDVNQAIMGQFHSVDQLTGRILGSLGYVGEEGRKRFNSLSKARRAAVLKEALTQKQLTQMAEAQSKAASGRWDTFKANIQETLGRVAAPLFAKLSSLLASANAWLEKNSATIDSVANAIGAVLGGALDAVLETLAFLTSGSDEAKAALFGIAMTITGFVVPALWAMFAGWVAAAAPILAVVAAVAAIGYGIIKLIKHWDKVRAIGGRTWDWIKGKARGFVDYLRDAARTIAAPFVAAFDAVKSVIQGVVDWVAAKVAWVTDKVEWVMKKAAEVKDLVVGSTGDAVQKAKAQLDAAQVVVASGGPSVSPTYYPPVGGGATKNVTIGPTSITVNANGMTPEQAELAVGRAVDQRLGDHLRAED